MPDKIPQRIVNGTVAVICGNGRPYATHATVSDADGYYSHELSDENKLLMLFDPYVVDIITTGQDRTPIIEHCKKTYNVDVEMPQILPTDQNEPPTYWVDMLTVEWIPTNSVFTMHVDDDGFESVIMYGDYKHPKWIEAPRMATQ